MKKLILTILISGAFAMPASAHHVPAHANDVTVKVDGMVCDFCAQSIIKLFNEKNEVDKVNINLDSKEVTLDFKPGKTLPSEDISQTIDYAGYKVEEIIR